jgi:hypothetical protein
MRNTLCNCPVTIQGEIERMSPTVGNHLSMDPTLVPALVRNLRLAGMAKSQIRLQLLGSKRSPTSGPMVTETRPADKWVACRTGHIAPLLAHAEVCTKGITPQHVIAAFWQHGKAVSKRRDPNATAPSDTLTKTLVSKANAYGLSGISEGFKIAQRFNRVR